LKPLRTIVCWIVVSVVLAACGATSGYRRADVVGQGLGDFREEIIGIQQSIDRTRDALVALGQKADVDPRGAFEAYSKAVDGFGTTCGTVKKRKNDMAAQGKGFCESWASELAKIQKEGKATSEIDKGKWDQIWALIAADLTDTDVHVAKYGEGLTQLRDLLRQDPSASAIYASKDTIQQLLDAGSLAERDTNELIAMLNRIVIELGPGSKK
jgi:hypothetical protein